jgi:cytochrome c oxidase cbb3-type subunit 1
MNQQEGYADDVVKSFIIWSMVWGFVAVLLGVVISLQLAFPQLNLPPYLS